MTDLLDQLVHAALAEDVGGEDITTNATVPEGARCRAWLVSKQDGVLSGMRPFRLVFEVQGAACEHWQALPDGASVHKGVVVASFTGDTRAVLTAERTALNFIQHLSGIATLTAKYVAAVQGLACRVCDTRKTTPLLRNLEKQAVLHGGGANHRPSLFQGVLIKENHIAAAGGIVEAVKRARQAAHHLMRVEVEARSLEEFELAMGSGADVIMLDNMALDAMREAVERAKGTRILLEASGNVTLETIRAIAETGVDFISVGALTHSSPVYDMSLLIENA
ncbi:MAG: carboxylating nicotinate-nucleotide diphosphorylase [Candidatus Hydrogenedentes bacterium]|nr:carboxylating nicotinate-nucleotide diphosphorylase [Candidatus Hydrogenedentota bacterium]